MRIYPFPSDARSLAQVSDKRTTVRVVESSTALSRGRSLPFSGVRVWLLKAERAVTVKAIS